ncbi:hypothetical protein L917_21340, partial [Phytophthora nicotianae]
GLAIIFRGTRGKLNEGRPSRIFLEGLLVTQSTF